MIETIIGIVVIYLALGILSTVFLSHTPYADNGWIKMVLLWPLFMFALLR